MTIKEDISRHTLKKQNTEEEQEVEVLKEFVKKIQKDLPFTSVELECVHRADINRINVRFFAKGELMGISRAVYREEDYEMYFDYLAKEIKKEVLMAIF